MISCCILKNIRGANWIIGIYIDLELCICFPILIEYLLNQWHCWQYLESYNWRGVSLLLFWFQFYSSDRQVLTNSYSSFMLHTVFCFACRLCRRRHWMMFLRWTSQTSWPTLTSTSQRGRSMQTNPGCPPSLRVSIM